MATLDSSNTLPKYTKGSSVWKFDPIALEVRSGPLWSTTRNNNYVSFQKGGREGRRDATPIRLFMIVYARSTAVPDLIDTLVGSLIVDPQIEHVPSLSSFPLHFPLCCGLKVSLF